ncbi:sigma-54-dependent Fis family transcriptional regulator [Echinicola pacifica]|uniref:Sigma-54-dependent Fis family transcriptional regulator n=1 Tax=Echinicola pacifica TaxID=346377 RepID=A0A918QDK6_9BACT|nr:sigma-54 dependent transcriptional regulator [Echinicola pacifica]GGZ39598.1 sigma-54-dependent Fis family transcriptional regulator [Echinicola pacifica]
MANAKILLIEDDLTYSKIIKNFLEKHSYEVDKTAKIAEAFLLMEKVEYDLVITDYRLPDGTGMEVLERVVDRSSNTRVILITNYSDIRTAVRSMKLGAIEYITKPVNPDELLATVKEALKSPAQRPMNAASNSENSSSTSSASSTPRKQMQETSEYVVGKSPESLQLEQYISLVAPTEMSVVVLGESGTGKEFISKRIHQKSSRAKGPFVAIDCGALSKELAGSELFGHVKGAFTGALENKTGHFEMANGGTIFLDEIGNLSYEVQIKLLRAIQERKIKKIGGTKDIPVDVRIIVATNEDLSNVAKTGEFREDLYHRLNEFSLKSTPLRERGTDLFHYADIFLQHANASLGKDILGFSEEVKEIFKTYSWPGNLRELKNIIKRAVLLTTEEYIQREALPVDLMLPENSSAQNSSTNDLKSSFEVQEKAMIIKTLSEVKHNKSKAAKILNIDRKTLYNKIEKYGIE